MRPSSLRTLDAYLIVTTQGLYFVNPRTGDIYGSFSGISCTDAYGVCVSGHPSSEFQNMTAHPDMAQGWARDWSWRRWDQISLKRLEGTSSLAAAAWAAIFDVETLDSARWGAGLSDTYGQVSSFEAVHGYCVGAILQISPRVNRGHSRTYYGERAKFDFVLDAPTSTSQFIANEILASINGWRKVEDGRLAIGIERRGHFPIWHFTDEQTERWGDGTVSTTPRRRCTTDHLVVRLPSGRPARARTMAARRSPGSSMRFG